MNNASKTFINSDTLTRMLCHYSFCKSIHVKKMDSHPGEQLSGQGGGSPSAEGREIIRGNSPSLRDAGLPPLPEPDHGLDIATMFDDDEVSKSKTRYVISVVNQ